MDKNTSIEQLITALDLKPHPEGGFYRETYRAGEDIDARALPERYRKTKRSVSTAIYYLLTPDTFSCMHRVASDEVFHFYLGDTVEMLQLHPSGAERVIELGPNFAGGQHLQTVVQAGVWQGARVKWGGAFALLGATVAPGFDFVDYEEGLCAELTKKYPTQEKLIAELTRK